MAPATYKVLTPSQVEHFLAHGYVVLPSAFSREQAQDAIANVWSRLGYDPSDPTTWLSDRVNMPWHKRFDVQTFCPVAWDAICDLLGGEERVDPNAASWSDGFICNFGSAKWDEAVKRGENPNDPKKLDNWHVDGDFFVHFLDSKEQGLLVIPLYTDIPENGGGTMICPDGIGKLAKWLMDHPQGVFPLMRPVDAPEKEDFDSLEWYLKTIQECGDFRQMTGKAGDVILMHPLMLHSASRNLLRTHRIITNPPVSLKESFNYDRSDPSQYSLVEQKTLQELAKLLKAEGRIQSEDEVKNGLRGWKISGERKSLVPRRMKAQEQLRRAEEARLRGEIVDADRKSVV